MHRAGVRDIDQASCRRRRPLSGMTCRLHRRRGSSVVHRIDLLCVAPTVGSLRSLPPISADIVGRVTAEPTTERDMQRRRVLTCYDAGSPIRSGCSSMASRGAAGWSWTAGGDDGEVRHVDRCWSGDGLLAWRDGRLGDFSKRAAQLYDRIQVRRQLPVEVGAVRAGPLVFVQVLTHLHAAVLLPGHAAVLEGSCWSARSRGAARTNELDAGERRLIIGSEEG